ncbi:MAG: hypothetical protein L6Q33_08860 [Bacteriovoracaceae bacterium]|nr:hypothetical protein [Bacteriovoracaceae bacterium]
MSKSNDQKFKNLSKYTFILFISETGIGSVLHGFKIPLSGHLLSLNQSFWLTRLTLQNKRKEDSNHAAQVSSILKSLSPTGKKLTPMLAISMQGFLFHLPLYFGINSLTLIVAGVFLSLWAFIQPLLIYLMIFGKSLLDVAQYFLEKLNEVIPFVPSDLSIILLLFIVIKILFSIFVSLFALKIDDQKEKQFAEKIENQYSISFNKPKKEKTFLKGLFFDLTRPLFLATFSLTILFFYFSESHYSKTIWSTLRPLASAIIIFSFLRLYPTEKILKLFKNDSTNKRLLENILKKIKSDS